MNLGAGKKPLRSPSPPRGEVSDPLLSMSRVVLTSMHFNRRVYDVELWGNQRFVVVGGAGLVADDGNLRCKYAVADTPDMQISDAIC